MVGNYTGFQGGTAFTLLLLLSMLSVLTPVEVSAGANILITPTRVVFEAHDRTAQVTIMNTGDEEGNFRVSFVRQNMSEDGDIVKVAKGEAGNFSDQMVRYSPRQFTLPPGQGQVVRLMLRKPRDLPEGEYRSHLLAQNIPNPSASSITSAVGKDNGKIKVEIVPIVGVSIPVIVRNGNLSGSVTLSNPQLVTDETVQNRKRVSVEMHRTGNASVYGDFRMIFTPTGGKPSVVGMVKGVVVYTPNTLRRYRIPLNIPEGVELKNGTLRIIYLKSGEDENTGLIAETSLSL